MNTAAPFMYNPENWKRAKTAMSMGQYVMKNRSAYMRRYATMRKRRTRGVYRMRKHGPFTSRLNARRKMRRNIGERPGSSSSKVHTVLSNNDLYDTRTLYDHDLLDIPHTTADGDQRGERQRQIARIAGFKICAVVGNERTNPIFVNIALLATKTGTYGTNDFFRGDGNERSVAFSTGLSSIEFRCCPINTDKYHILMHRRLLLNGSSAITGVDYQRSIHQLVEKWLPLRRQIRWENENGATTSNEDMRLVWWGDSIMQPGGALAQADAFRINYKVTTYFRDP